MRFIRRSKFGVGQGSDAYATCINSKNNCSIIIVCRKQHSPMPREHRAKLNRVSSNVSSKRSVHLWRFQHSNLPSEP